MLQLDNVEQHAPKHKLQSYALDNARERLASFTARNQAVMDEYFRLRDEVREAAAAVRSLEREMRRLVRNLEIIYGR